MLCSGPQLRWPCLHCAYSLKARDCTRISVHIRPTPVGQCSHGLRAPYVGSIPPSPPFGLTPQQRTRSTPNPLAENALATLTVLEAKDRGFQVWLLVLFTLSFFKGAVFEMCTRREFTGPRGYRRLRSARCSHPEGIHRSARIPQTPLGTSLECGCNGGAS